jgi:hypothetical protein
VYPQTALPATVREYFRGSHLVHVAICGAQAHIRPCRFRSEPEEPVKLLLQVIFRHNKGQ